MLLVFKNFGASEEQLIDVIFVFKGGTAYPLALYGEGTGSIYLDNVVCYGYESSVWNCVNNGIGVHNCLHSMDASVQCAAAGLFYQGI